MQTDLYLLNAVDRNIIVFDYDNGNGPGEIVTKRLIKLMNAVAKDNIGYKIKTFYVPTDVKVEKPWFVGTFVGHPHFNSGCEIMEGYNKLGCTLPNGTSRIIIGVTKTGEALIGAF